MGCCWFWLTAAPFVAKLSGAVRARDVMFNVDNRSKSDAYIYWCSGSRRYYI